MSEPIDPTKLDTCGCCAEGPDEPEHRNPPGQPELKYRIGTHPTFLQRMLNRIYEWEIPDGDSAGQRPLAALTTRSSDDPAIALLDVWATVGDVLTFYQERIANEGFLRTATERRSVLELARAIGYELNPGVAAESYAAFTVDDAEGSPTSATVPRGTAIQSVPTTQDELPQTFETTEELVARVRWNALRPRLNHPQTLTNEVTRVYLTGTTTGLERGDVVLVEIGTERTARKIVDLEIDTEHERTRIDFVAEGTPASDTPAGFGTPTTLDPTQEPLELTRANVQAEIFNKTWREQDLQAFLPMHEWEEQPVLDYIADLGAAEFQSDSIRVYAFRERLGFFGNNAPFYDSLPDKPSSSGGGGSTGALFAIEGGGSGVSEIADTISEGGGGGPTKHWPVDWDASPPLSIWKDSLTGQHYQPQDVYLEQQVEGLAPDSWVVFERPTNTFRAYKIADAVQASRAGFGISAKVTGLELHKEDGAPLNNNTTDKPEEFRFRTSSAHVGAQSLTLAALPVTEPLSQGDTELLLDEMVLGLVPGHPIVLTGEVLGTNGAEREEILFIDEVRHAGGLTRLTLKNGLRRDYRRETVRLNVSVVLANHGETVKDEVLGNGDGATKNQRFELKKSPLTYVSAANATGSESTLSIRVNGIEWTRERSLYQLDDMSRNYTVRIDDDAKASVIFGDGEQGARLPTGQENVTATYRSGIGSDGEVAADSLTLLKSRPFGIRSVTNPLAASGADDPETLAEARTNAPLTVMTLDRIVSLKDYEDFARAFAGIGKAQAVQIWDGKAERVHITVADANGDEVISPLFENLSAAIEGARDPLREVELASFQLLVFFVEARVLIDPAYLWDDVRIAAETALKEAFSFEGRAFAQPVTAAEVLQVLHDVDGVVAVDLDKLYKRTPDAMAPTGNLFNSVLDAQPARYDKSIPDTLPAQLLLIHEFGIGLSEMTR